ncbi:MAG: FHA domain-containing protein [Planctomycetes bacterium]|nr:FHA domain-containing protein [Planctomycetota bacterium]
MNRTQTPILIALTEGTNILLDKPIILIGRHQECDVQIPSRKISRKHCCIAQVNDHFVVRDLGSTNGIRINGLKVMEGNLKINDELIIGNLRYQIRSGEEADGIQREKHWPRQNGVHAGEPPIRGPRREAAIDGPMPIGDLAQSHPILTESAEKRANADHDATVKPGMMDMEIPDHISLAPLDPLK